MGLKLAVVGGGSTYTPELVDGFTRRADRVAVDETALLDIDPERLAIVGGLAERMLARQGWTGHVLQTTDRDAAIDDADSVLVQLRVDGRGDVQVVNVRNDGTLPGLADADIVEVLARIDRDGAHPLPQAPLSAAQFELVTRVKAYERLTIRAAVSGDMSIARAALAANPLAGDPEQASDLFDAILEMNGRWLPRFLPNR